MKERLRSYFTFHRGQRMGLLILMSLVIILTSGIAIMHSRSVPRAVSNSAGSHIPATEDSSAAAE